MCFIIISVWKTLGVDGGVRSLFVVLHQIHKLPHCELRIHSTHSRPFGLRRPCVPAFNDGWALTLWFNMARAFAQCTCITLCNEFVGETCATNTVPSPICEHRRCLFISLINSYYVAIESFVRQTHSMYTLNTEQRLWADRHRREETRQDKVINEKA